MVGVCRKILQEPYSNFCLRNFIHRRVAQAKNLPKVCILEIFVYIYLSRPSIRKVCSWDYKNLWCLLFGTTHFSHPFLGTYEVHQFLDLGYLGGTHSSMVYVTYTIPWYGGMATSYHSRVFLHTTASYTIPVVLSVNQYQIYHHTIPVILYHGSHRVAGVLSQKIQKDFCRLLC